MRVRLLLVTCALLLSDGASVSIAATLQGAVRDGVTGEPLDEAVVLVYGTELGGPSDRNGEYMIWDLPDSSGIVTASSLGYLGVSVRFSATPGCTIKQDFYLFPGVMDTVSFLPKAESLFKSLRLDFVQAVTVDAPLSTNDTAAISRNNRARRNLLELYLKGGGYGAAERFEAWHGPVYVRAALRDKDSVRLRPNSWAATGKGVCFYRCWYPRYSDVIVGPDDRTYEVMAVAAGYFRTDSSGRREFVVCHGSYPKDKWLVLKLDLRNGGTVFF